MKRRWAVVDRHGRMMIGFRTRSGASRWLKDVRKSNPPAVDGWRRQRMLYAELGCRVVASNIFCPDRRLYKLQADGWWHCACCGERRSYRALVEPRPVSAWVPAGREVTA